MSADVVCMALANVPSGEQRSRFLAVGLADNTVRIISLEPNVSLDQIIALIFLDCPTLICTPFLLGLPHALEHAGAA